MNYTENYQLNQWAKSDRVLMEDFNSDNQKIDAALANIPMQKLLEHTVTKATGKIDLDLTDYDLSRYLRLELHLSGRLSAYGGVSIRLNDQTGEYFYHSGTSTQKNQANLLSFTMTNNPGGGKIDFFLFDSQLLAIPHCANWDYNTIYFTDGSGSIRSSALSARDVHTINLLADNQTFQPGTKITLFGIQA